jgi:hypothetical protein
MASVTENGIADGSLVILPDDTIVSDVKFARLREDTGNIINAYHAENPLADCIPRQELLSRLKQSWYSVRRRLKLPSMSRSRKPKRRRSRQKPRSSRLSRKLPGSGRNMKRKPPGSRPEAKQRQKPSRPRARQKPQPWSRKRKLTNSTTVPPWRK